ncbi:MAG: cation transporter [Pseudonocardia sp.]|nr:cation transporter [Pseudonocardia sp.]
MTATTVTVHGMTCGHCVRAVTSEISALPGVCDIGVDLVAATVTVTSTATLDRAALAAAVYDAGCELAS